MVAHAGEEAAKVLARPDTVVIHCKGVFTAKPDPEGLFKRKCRIVACGNESKQTDADSLYESGIPADILRASLTEASARSWSVGVTDIHAAFLQAPMPESGSSRYILKPPRWLIEGGYIPPSEIWTLKKVLYGFRESPAWWASHRDKCLATLELSHAGAGYRLHQSQTDSSLWRVQQVSPSAASVGSSFSGLLLTYVDDLLFLGPPDLCKAVYAKIGESFGWDLDPLQFVSPEQRIKFLGMEVVSLPGTEDKCPGFGVTQSGYIEEVLRSNEVSSSSLSKIVCQKRCFSLQLPPKRHRLTRHWSDPPSAWRVRRCGYHNAQGLIFPMLWAWCAVW